MFWVLIFRSSYQILLNKVFQEVFFADLAIWSFRYMSLRIYVHFTVEHDVILMISTNLESQVSFAAQIWWR